jgi:hypothetical protein
MTGERWEGRENSEGALQVRGNNIHALIFNAGSK